MRWKNRPEGSNWGDFGPDDQIGRLSTGLGQQVVRTARCESVGSAPLVLSSAEFAVPEQWSQFFLECHIQLTIHQLADDPHPGLMRGRDDRHYIPLVVVQDDWFGQSVSGYMGGFGRFQAGRGMPMFQNRVDSSPAIQIVG